MDRALVIFTIKLANKKSSFQPVLFHMGAWSPPLPPPPPHLQGRCQLYGVTILLTAMLSKNLTLSQQINLRAVHASGFANTPKLFR